MIQRIFKKRASYVIVCSVSLLFIISGGFDINVTTTASFPALSVTSVSNNAIPGALADTRDQATNAAGLRYDSFSPHFSEECALIINGSAPQTTIQKAINVSNHQYLCTASWHGFELLLRVRKLFRFSWLLQQVETRQFNWRKLSGGIWHAYLSPSRPVRATVQSHLPAKQLLLHSCWWLSKERF